jgi:hypothetical protein
MAKKTKKTRARYPDERAAPPTDERIAMALERIADSLEAFEDAAIYDNEGDAPFVGVSINHSPEVVGDDVFSPRASEEDEEEEDG